MSPMRASRVLLMVVLLSLVGGGPAMGVTATPAAGWGPPVRVLPGAWTDVSAAVDSDGAVHVAAAGSTGVWYATDRTGSWVGKQLLHHRPGSEWRGVSLALDGHDRVTIALSEVFPSEFGDVPGRIWTITDKGRPRGSFSTPTAVTPSGSTDPSLKTPGGHTYLAWTGDVCVDVCEGAASRVWYQTDGPGGWLRRRMPGDASAPDLRVDDAGRPRLVYVQRGPTRSRLTLATAGSRTGPFTTQLVTAQAGELSPRLILGAGGRPVVAWARDPYNADPSRVFLARRVSGHWAVRSIGAASVVAITVDTVGTVHLAIGGGSGVREVVVRSTLTSTPIDMAGTVTDVELREPSSGHALAVYIRTSPDAGVHVARR